MTVGRRLNAVCLFCCVLAACSSGQDAGDPGSGQDAGDPVSYSDWVEARDALWDDLRWLEREGSGELAVWCEEDAQPSLERHASVMERVEDDEVARLSQQMADAYREGLDHCADGSWDEAEFDIERGNALHDRACARVHEESEIQRFEACGGS